MTQVDDDNLQYDEFSCLFLLDGLPFEGVSVERWPAGHLKSRTEWRGGRLHGVVREWYESGRLKSAGTLRCGSSHGLFRSYHSLGRPQIKKFCHSGYVITELEWNPQGDLVGEYTLPEDDFRFAEIRKRTFDAAKIVLKPVKNGPNGRFVFQSPVGEFRGQWEGAEPPTLSRNYHAALDIEDAASGNALTVADWKIRDDEIYLVGQVGSPHDGMVVVFAEPIPTDILAAYP